MKKMIVKNWKRIASVLMAVILVVGSVNLSELSASAEGENTEPNAVGGLSLNDFSLYQFLTYYQYVIKGNATIGNHTVGSMLIGGEGTIGAFGEGALAPVYVHNLQGSGNYAERYPEISKYYTEQRVPAYYGEGSAETPSDWNVWSSNDKFVDFETVFNGIAGESRNIANSYDVLIDYSGSGFSITGNNDAVTVEEDFIQGKWGNLLTIDFSKISSITITNAAFQKLVAIDIHVNNIDDFNKPHNISILGGSVNVSYAYNPAMGTHPSNVGGAVCVTINGATFQGGALKSMTGNKQAGQLLDAPMELLWNFPDAEAASVEYLGGHVVAPKATVTIYGGNFEGGVIAEQLINNSAEGHMYPYFGIPKNFNETPPEKPEEEEEEESLKITVPICIEKRFGSSDFSNANERSSVLQKTYFAVFHDNNGYVQTIRYNQEKDTYSGIANTATYGGEFTFAAEKEKTYYFYLAEVKTDTDNYEICNLCWAIKVEVDSSGNSTTTYVQYKPIYDKGVDVTPQDELSGYDSKNDPLEFVNGKIEVEDPDPTPGTATVTIGLNKIYQGLDLTSYTGDVEKFLSGTKFELVEVSGDAQNASDIGSPTTITPVQNGSDAVVSREITITEGTTKYYRISETKASDGFDKAVEVYIWKITYEKGGEVSARYKIGYNGSYRDYTEGDSYPEIINNAVSYSGTISLYKTYGGDVSVLSGMNDQQREEFLGQTVFRLYSSYNDATDDKNPIGDGVSPVWEGDQAVVKFELDSDFTVGLNKTVSYYIRETAATSGYVKSNVVYECRISNVNGIYKVEYSAGNGVYTQDIIKCNNVKQIVEIKPVTVAIEKKFDDGFSGLNAGQITNLISNTEFSFYTEDMTKTDVFVPQSNSSGNSGKVTYTYNYTGELELGQTYTYYVKETNTNKDIYEMDNTVYKIVIAVGQPTLDATNKIIYPSVTYTNVDKKVSVTELSFTNKRIPKAKSPAEITFTKVFANIGDLNAGEIISATHFTLYDDQNHVVTGFSQPTTSTPDADGNVTYTYSLVTSSLNAGKPYYYYLKETGTNRNYYLLNDTTYAVRIEIDADGKPTVSYAEAPSGSILANLVYEENLTITNQRTPDDSPKVLNSPVIEFTKVFLDLENYTDSSDIVTKTTFTITGDDGSDPIGYTMLSSAMTGNRVTYSYQLDLSDLSVGEYTGGTYVIKESSTDNRYALSSDELKFEIAVSDDGKVTVTFIGGVKTITNKPNNPSTTPSTPSGGGGNSTPPSGGGGNNPGPNSPSGGGDNPGPNPPSDGGNNPGPNPPSDAGNDSTTQSDTDSATTSLVSSDGASAGRETSTLSNMTSAQTGERKLPWAVLGGGMSMIFIAGTVYVFKKKEKIEE